MMSLCKSFMDQNHQHQFHSYITTLRILNLLTIDIIFFLNYIEPNYENSFLVMLKDLKMTLFSTYKLFSLDEPLSM